MRESESAHLLGLYYLVSWKRYPEEENTWESASVVQHLKKLINLFHKNHPDKSTATSPAINIAPLMVRSTVKPTDFPKQKRGWPANSTNKRVKKWAAFDFYRVFGWIWVTSMSNILSSVVRDCTWLSTNRFSQNFHFLTSSSLSHKASVFFLELPLGQEVFHRQPSTVTGFPFQSPVIGLGGFSPTTWSFETFQSPVIGLGGFSPTTWSFETYQLSYGARMFSLVPWFSSSIQLISWKVFYRVPIQDSSSNKQLHTQWSSRLRRKAIIMSWLHDLSIKWSRHVTTHIIYSHNLDTWSTNFILTLSHH